MVVDAGARMTTTIRTSPRSVAAVATRSFLASTSLCAPTGVRTHSCGQGGDQLRRGRELDFVFAGAALSFFGGDGGGVAAGVSGIATRNTWEGGSE